ncbi:Hypothetical predicted protein [Mytilus galloprovincialis]|uniref:FLYWCH-type domain-containing protein n=1 Tax=Mytilus galloprovincialis TaxID=29158 RepID=A0A8B6CPQ1_MYTGA|nr:Hypothetical predicted protein [Mytilus galloprovincialis]
MKPPKRPRNVPKKVSQQPAGPAKKVPSTRGALSKSQNTTRTVQVSRTATDSNLAIASGPVINIVADAHQEPPFVAFRIQDEMDIESPNCNEGNALDRPRGALLPLTPQPGPSGIKSRRGDRCYWKCSTRNCPAATTTNTHNNIPPKVDDNHNHPSDRMQLRVDDVLQRMTSRCKDKLTAIPTIYEEELVKLRNREWNDDTHQVVEHIPNFYSCKDQLYNERHQLIPALPTTVEDITVHGELAQTTTGQPFLLADDSTNRRMLVFSTQENLYHLATADTIYCDITFYVCPTLFYQLYTFHAKVDGTTSLQFPTRMISLLRQEEAFHALTLIQYRAGGKRIQRKRKYREIDDRLQTLKIRLQNDELTPV